MEYYFATLYCGFALVYVSESRGFDMASVCIVTTSYKGQYHIYSFDIN